MAFVKREYEICIQKRLYNTYFRGWIELHKNEWSFPEKMKTSQLHTCFFLFLCFLHIQSNNKLMAQGSVDLNRLIKVSGDGTVQAIPDMATVRFGIVIRDEDPEEARRVNAETAKEAMNSIRALGVEESKLKLQTIRLQPVREYDPETRRQVEKGYEAIRDVVVVVEDLDRLPTIISHIVQKGANRLNGITYGLKNKESVKDEALIQAVNRAKQKAELMSATLGVRVGKVIQIQEQGISVPQPVLMQEASRQVMLSKSSAAPEPEAYAAGEIEVKATVIITFEIE